jgi:curved DNA-binding protein CbpA
MLEEYYTMLDLKPGATIDEIKHAFRSKAKLFHPDVNHSAEAHFQFIQMKEAFDILLKIKSIENYRKQRAYRSYHPHDPYFNSPHHSYSYHTTTHRHHDSSNKAESNDFFNKKSGRTIYLLVHVLFILTGILIFTGPIYTLITRGLDPYRTIFDSVFAMIPAMTFGVIMVYKISISFIRFIKQGP